ncbi:hypothetical protein JCM11641_004120 [Rhodosporidiobolus odoratus]
MEPGGKTDAVVVAVAEVIQKLDNPAAPGDEATLPYLDLPVFMNVSIFVEYIAPWADYTFTDDVIPVSSNPPPWTGWLESYYQAFHPKAWVVLDEEYKALTKYVSDMNDWVKLKLYRLHYVREQYLDYYRRLSPVNSDEEIIARTTSMEGYPAKNIPRHSGT